MEGSNEGPRKPCTLRKRTLTGYPRTDHCMAPRTSSTTGIFRAALVGTEWDRKWATSWQMATRGARLHVTGAMRMSYIMPSYWVPLRLIT